MTKIKLATIIALLMPIIGWSGNKPTIINGIVTDEINECLECAGITISQDSDIDNIIKHTISDEFGKFAIELEQGVYMLKITYLGYEIYSQKLIVNHQETIDLGVIAMKPTVVELQTVVVQGKPLNVRMQPDGFSINTTTIAKSSNNALDLLGQLPYVRVKNDELSVIGKETVVVKINDVVQRVDASELTNILRGYDASLIKKVEILTTPPQRYNTDGNTAMIVIHTNSFFEQYMGGIIGTELMIGEKHNGRYGGYASVVYNKNNLYVDITPSINHTASYMHEHTFYDYDNNGFYEVITPSEGDQNYVGSILTTQYKYNDNGYVGLSGTIGNRKVDNQFYSNELGENYKIDNQNDVLIKQPKGKIALYWEHKIGKNNTLWLETSYYDHLQRSDISFVSEDKDTQLLTYDDNARLHVKGFGLNNDYSVKLGQKYTLDFGIKMVFTQTKNNRHYNQVGLSPNAESFEQYDGIKLTENSYTPYITATVQFSNTWQGRLGLKTTFDYRKIRSIDNTVFDKSFISWLPDILLSYTPSLNHRLSFTLNSSIRQPNFDQINPFEWKVNNNSYNRGNTELKPETRYTFRLGYTYQGAISITAIARFNRNSIQSVSLWNGTNIITQTENAQNGELYRLQLGYYFDKTEWLNFSINAYWGKDFYHGLIPEVTPKSSGYSWGTDGYLNFILNKSRTLTAYLSGTYNGKTKTTVSINSPFYSVGAGVNWFLLNRKLAVTLAGLDIWSSYYEGYSHRDGYTLQFKNKYNYPTLYLSISYKFNNIKNSSPNRSMTTKDIDNRL